MNMIPQMETKPGTALVLSGGATKAFYFHLGVLKVLRPENITSIVGASAGSIVGAFIATGTSVETLITSLYQKRVYVPKFDTWLDNMTSSRLFKPQIGQLTMQSLYTGYTGLRFLASLPFAHNKDVLAEILDHLINSQSYATGFFDATALEEMFQQLLPTGSFSETEIDLYVTGTALDSRYRGVFNSRYDFQTDEDLFMTDVPIHRAVRASSALPGMFEPVLINDRYYVDGEIKRTLSADIGVSVADRIIISHTYQPLYLDNGKSVRDMGWFNILRQSLVTVLHERINRWREFFEEQPGGKEIIWIQPDPDDVEFFRAPEFTFRPEVQKRLIRSGEIAAQKVLDKIVT
ncbi:MAG: patatin-like phospholipase family protein [Chloroflexota bacterium]